MLVPLLQGHSQRGAELAARVQRQLRLLDGDVLEVVGGGPLGSSSSSGWWGNLACGESCMPRPSSDGGPAHAAAAPQMLTFRRSREWVALAACAEGAHRHFAAERDAEAEALQLLATGVPPVSAGLGAGRMGACCRGSLQVARDVLAAMQEQLASSGLAFLQAAQTASLAPPAQQLG